MTTMPTHVSTTNACKLCKPLGAAIAFRGVAGCVPFLHGSQGCATYMRRYIISHFNEPIDIASSSLGEKHAIYGGAANLKLGLKNVTEKYRPQVIGLATTCLTETIGDDVPMILHEYLEAFGDKDTPEVVTVSTPSYSGTHMEGFHAVTLAVVERFAEAVPAHSGVNLFSGFISPADIRYLQGMLTDFGISATLLPDYSDTLDGPALNDYPLIPSGGTPVAAIRAMGGARLSIELGATLPKQTGGRLLQERFGVDRVQTGLPIGLRATDTLVSSLEKTSGRTLPYQYEQARGRLVDAMVDGHKYVSGRRAAIYGEEDLVVGLTSFLAEIGIKPVLCVSGGKSGRLEEAIGEAVAGLDCELPQVWEGADFFDLEQAADELGVELLVGHSKGYSYARRAGIPLIRVGFPIHDRIGGQRLLHLGYHGAQKLFDTIVNAVIAGKQEASPVGYTYM